jgi:hypothetical protein
MPYKPAPAKEVPVVYVGALPGVTISATGTHAQRGIPVEVPADVAERLLEQATWATPKKKAADLQEVAETGETS